jgi:hypothetical protein
MKMPASLNFCDDCVLKVFRFDLGLHGEKWGQKQNPLFESGLYVAVSNFNEGSLFALNNISNVSFLAIRI